MVKKKETKEKKLKKFNIEFLAGLATSNAKDEAKLLYDQSRFGEAKEDKIKYSLVEVAYLLEQDKVNMVDGRDKKIKFDDFVKKATKLEPNFWVRYVVFRDMRNRGYIVKTALKFGADFRVYDRGIKPGQDHAKWILYPVREADVFSWYDFAAKNRVAHSTRKNLLIAIVDDELDTTYYSISWTRP